MKPHALSLLLILVFTGLASAQAEKSITNWTKLDRPGDEFSIEVPEGFEFEKSKDLDEKIDARGDFHSNSERFFLFIDDPKNPYKRKQVEKFLSFSRQQMSEITPVGYAAAKVEFKDLTGFYHRVVFVKTRCRVFTLQTVSLQKDSQPSNRFMESFRLQPISQEGSDCSSTQDPPSASVEPNVTEPPSLVPEGGKASGSGSISGSGSGQGMGYGTGTGSGSGSGRGSGSGDGSGTGAANPPPLPDVKRTSALRIISKRKALYTDFGRFYMIQGSVTLRVTFLASGAIGSITPIEKLPFGLTETAIDAAKLMRFEPQMVNGVAQTTTRPVNYTFTIY